MKIVETTYNIQTGQETIIERAESKSEEASRLELLKIAEAKEIANEAKATARAALLERMGLTAEEAALLLS